MDKNLAELLRATTAMQVIAFEIQDCSIPASQSIHSLTRAISEACVVVDTIKLELRRTKWTK